MPIISLDQLEELQEEKWRTVQTHGPAWMKGQSIVFLWTAEYFGSSKVECQKKDPVDKEKAKMGDVAIAFSGEDLSTFGYTRLEVAKVLEDWVAKQNCSMGREAQYSLHQELQLQNWP